MLSGRVEVVVGDITKVEVDVIVNAANPWLIPGGGVDGAIHRAAGPELAIETKKIGGCEVGDVVVTPGFNLKAKYVIHAVAPKFYVAGDLNEKESLLASCYRKSLDMARLLDARSIAFPAIGTGHYGWPHEESVRVAIKTIREWLLHYRSGVFISIVVTSNDLAEVYRGKI
jgi:O-acetyl-ADP-ribose deacetylase (regulator of RNase III)